MVEQLICNQSVVGSTPTAGSFFLRSTPKIGGRDFLFFDWMCSSALCDDTESVILEILEAICASLDELHFAVEAFGDAVVFGEAPHARDLLPPSRESPGESSQRSEAAVGKLAGDVQQLWCELLTLPCVLVTPSQQGAEALHLVVNGARCRMSTKQNFKFTRLSR